MWPPADFPVESLASPFRRERGKDGAPLSFVADQRGGSSGPESACLPYGFKVKGSGQECPLYTVAFVAPFEVVVIDRAACKE